MDRMVEKLAPRHRWLILVAMKAQIRAQIRGLMAAAIIAQVFGSSGVAHAAA